MALSQSHDMDLHLRRLGEAKAEAGREEKELMLMLVKHGKDLTMDDFLSVMTATDRILKGDPVLFGRRLRGKVLRDHVVLSCSECSP